MKTQTVVTYGSGGFDPSKPNGNVTSEESFDVEDEEQAPILVIDKLPSTDLDVLTAFVKSKEKEVDPEMLTSTLRIIISQLIAVKPIKE